MVFENINFISRLGDYLVLTSSRVSCICWCVYILTSKEGEGSIKMNAIDRTLHNSCMQSLAGKKGSIKD